MITTNLRIVAIVGSVALLLFIVELVRRRRLKEEYSVLWVTTALLLCLLAAWGGLLGSLTHAIGAVSQGSTLYFFGLIFALLLLLHFSVRVSDLERRVISMTQEIALLGARAPSDATNDGQHPVDVQPARAPSDATNDGQHPVDVQPVDERAAR
jgi:hypothetical protein